MVREPVCVFSGGEPEVLVLGDSLVKYVVKFDACKRFQVVCLPGEGVRSVGRWLQANIAPKYKLVIIHVWHKRYRWHGIFLAVYQ